jgi:beta-N-acetylhexosaminidase
MEGAASVGDFPERARQAQLAGCDMILVCNNPAAAEQVLNALPVTVDPLRQHRLQAMQGKFHLNREQLMNTQQWQHITNLLTQGNQHHA